MLTKTFCHIKGISIDCEKILWENGISHWDEFLINSDRITCLPRPKLDKIKEELSVSQLALQKRDLQYFKSQLPSKEHWRLHNFGKMAFVDIETSGLSKWSNIITVIGIYDGMFTNLYVNGKNLQDAHAKLMEYDIIVTYNGKQFDLPFIENHFSHTYDFVHLDLRYMLKEFGYQGGLKNIERQVGIIRDADLEGVDGFEAVRLWNQYKRGSQDALNKLLKYNEQDIINLKTLLELYLHKKQAQLTS